MVYKAENVLKKVLIVSAHPDDETFGAGGSLFRLKSLGNKIYWINTTSKKKQWGFSQREVTLRRNELKKVIKAYKFNDFIDLGLRPAGLDEYPLRQLISTLSIIFKKIQPQVLILPYKNDIHSDHQIVFKAGFAAAKSFRQNSIKEILMMEVLSETNFAKFDKPFSPNYYMDITGYLDKKIKILSNYRSELGRHPFPRSLEAVRSQAILRGAQSGCLQAEGFTLLKGIY